MRRASLSIPLLRPFIEHVKYSN